jgi:hypothetical protein
MGEPMTTTAEGAEHLHHRPDWDCRICKQPWPCDNAKAGLLAEFSTFPSVLTIYLSTQMYDAMGDFSARGLPAPPDLYERFLSWVRHSRIHGSRRMVPPERPRRSGHARANKHPR